MSASGTDQKKARSAPPEVRRKQLIEATITCIAKGGISGTTLTGGAKEAGLSRGLANFHFKSKDALLAETISSLAQEHRDLGMKALTNADLTPLAKLCSIVDAQFHRRVCSQKSSRRGSPSSGKRDIARPIA